MKRLQNERSFTVKKRSIYGDRSQEILRLYEEAGSSRRVLCVALDYAKKHHVVMFCDGEGDILRKPFSVENSPGGITTLTEHVKQWCDRRQISERQVFFGGEDAASYAENFVESLRSGGWLVAGVNAADAKKQRSTVQASTDRIDLMGIARMLVNKRGNCSPAQVGVYRNLRTLVRHRRRLVMMTTGVRNRIHVIVDQLFPGFLDERKSGVSPFSQSSLWLMGRRFSASQIRRRKRSILVAGLRRWGSPHPERVAAQIQDYAASVLHSSVEYVSTLQLSLAQHVKHLRCLQENVDQAEKEIAVWLAETQGAFLTSIRGIGIVLSAGVTAEIGDPTAQKPVSNLCSYGGIIPRVSQTGGPEGDSHTGSVGKRSNRILKDYVVQSGQHLGLHGPAELMADYQRRDANGQHAAFGMARRYMRMGMHLMKTSQVYLPARLRRKDSRPEERASYYLATWPYLKNKWQKTDALLVAFAPEHPLGQWRHMVQEVYGIKLTL